jgi:hypothetical protein
MATTVIRNVARAVCAHVRHQQHAYLRDADTKINGRDRMVMPID